MNEYTLHEQVQGITPRKTLIRFVGNYLRPYLSRIWIATALVILGTVFSLMVPYLFKHLIDDLFPQRKLPLLLWFSLGYFLLEFSTLSFSFFRSLLFQKIGQGIMADLREALHRKVFGFSYSFFDQNSIGRLVNRVTNDVQSLSELFSENLVAVLADLLLLVGTFLFMVKLNPFLTLVVSAIVPLLWLITFYFNPKFKFGFRKNREAMSRMTGFLSESISGMREVQIFGKEKMFLGEFDELNNEILHSNVKVIRTYGIYYPLINNLSFLALAVAIYWGGKHVLNHGMSVGEFTAFTLYVANLANPIKNIAERWSTFQTGMTSAERVFQLLDFKSSEESLKRLSQQNVVLTDSARSDDIRFVDVWMTYKPSSEQWVLKNANFHIPAQKTTAVVGPTGAGKTSIISALRGNYPYQKGELYWGDTLITHIEASSLQKNIGVVSQDLVAFRGSVLDNIRLWDDSIPLSLVEKVAAQVSLDKVLGPGCLNVHVLERGSNLSVGTKQLISLARVLIRNPSLLILDESTSSIDGETESLVLQAIKEASHHRTTVVIAHRLSTIQNADQIIVLGDGSVQESGTHEELMKQAGHYQKLVESQLV